MLVGFYLLNPEPTRGTDLTSVSPRVDSGFKISQLLTVADRKNRLSGRKDNQLI